MSRGKEDELLRGRNVYAHCPSLPWLPIFAGFSAIASLAGAGKASRRLLIEMEHWHGRKTNFF